MKCIDHVRKLSNDILTQNNILNIDLPREKNGETYRFYFHRELHIPNVREAIDSLCLSIINTWNAEVENDTLPIFLNSIQAGPCIEGATRVPLDVSVARRHAVTSLPMPFNTAMEEYHQQAKNLLQHLHVTPTPNNIKKLIFDKYNGRSCLPHNDDPTIISAESIQNYLDALQIYESNYFSLDNPAKLTEFHHLPISTCMRIIDTVVPYADADNAIELETLSMLYKRLISYTKSSATPDIANYIGALRKTGFIWTNYSVGIIQ